MLTANDGEMFFICLLAILVILFCGVWIICLFFIDLWEFFIDIEYEL